MGCCDFFVSGAIGEQIWVLKGCFGHLTSIFNIMGITCIIELFISILFIGKSKSFGEVLFSLLYELFCFPLASNQKDPYNKCVQYIKMYILLKSSTCCV